MVLNKLKMIGVGSELHKYLKTEAVKSTKVSGRHVSIGEWLHYALLERIESQAEVERLTAQGYDLTLDEKYEQKLSVELVSAKAELQHELGDWQDFLEQSESDIEALIKDLLELTQDAPLPVRERMITFRELRLQRKEDLNLRQEQKNARRK